MKRHFLFLFMGFVLCGHMAVGQGVVATDDEGEDDPYDSVSYFMVGFNYLSDNVYLGRKDTFAIPYYTPYVGYHYKNGLFVKGMVSYTPAKGGTIDLTTLEAGWEHSFTDHMNGGLVVDRFFYNKNSISIRANTTASGGVYGQYNNDALEPTISFDVNANAHSTDYVVGLLLDHDFKLSHKALHLIPTIGLIAGTQNYYDEYFINRLNKKDKKGNTKRVVADPNQLVPLVEELSMKMTYMVGKWLFTLSPIYAIPMSPATITINKKTSQEKIVNSFFVELDICHR